MFLSVLGGSVFKTIDPDEERDPPADPTPVDFPSYGDSAPLNWTDATRLPNFQALFARILKPDDITDVHAEALNVHLVCDCPLYELIPPTPSSPQLSTSPDERLSQRQKDFEERIAELSIDNDTAFRTLTRTLPSGVKGPRLAWTRKFWCGLESMSPYWDCSLDQYYTAAETGRGEDKESIVKRGRFGSDGRQPQSLLEGAEEKSSASPTEVDAVPANLSVETPGTRSRYKGRRTGSGKDMPDAFRSETVRALVETASFPFQCSVLPPRKMPVIQFNKLNLPVRQTAAVYRVPTDRTRARQGIHEGPLMALQVRSDIDFRDSEEASRSAKSRLDVLREIGGLMQIVQERCREHQVEVKPGEGKWWTTQQRWGGGPGNHEEDASDVVQLAEDSLNAMREHTAANSKGRRRRTPLAIWKELKVGSGHWDPRTNYMAIGRDPNSPYDEVFMVSSINHHVSILKFRVHNVYIASNESGQYPEQVPLESDWSRPVLYRSRWYDMFNREERIEAFTGIWNVLAYMIRGPDSPDQQVSQA